MRTHRAACLQGPRSGSRPWWRPAKDRTLFRAALVEQIRQEIAEGTYDTPEKWDVALERLLEQLERE
jgi:hypothetical protein